MKVNEKAYTEVAAGQWGFDPTGNHLTERRQQGIIHWL